MTDTDILCRFADRPARQEKGDVTEYKPEDGAGTYYMNDKVCVEIPDKDFSGGQNYTVMAIINVCSSTVKRLHGEA